MKLDKVIFIIDKFGNVYFRSLKTKDEVFGFPNNSFDLGCFTNSSFELSTCQGNCNNNYWVSIWTEQH